MRNRPQSMSGNSSRSDHGGNAVRDELTESFSRSYFVDAVGIERDRSRSA
jgi:hypothetical protein